MRLLSRLNLGPLIPLASTTLVKTLPSRVQTMLAAWLQNHPRCLLCEQSCNAGKAICQPCEDDLPWLGNPCQQCALPLPKAGLLCGQCLTQPPAFEQVSAAWRYEFPLDALINRFKHQANWPIGHLLADLFATRLKHAFLAGLRTPDYLVAVPLGKKRQRQRGFNQAQMIADWLAQRLNLPVAKHLLQRTRETTEQQSLSAAQRKRNLRHAFTLTTDRSIQGLHLALVDDVVTTGSTAQCISRLLLDGGAASVSVYCLARTPKPDDRH